MHAPAMDPVSSIVSDYLSVSSSRPEILFRHFLPTGYRKTTLSSVPDEHLESAIVAKVHVGMLITLYDDLADHPGQRNPRLLGELYRLNVGVRRRAPAGLRGGERRIFELARHLFARLDDVLVELPGREWLLPALRFDIEQFYAANRHAELISALPAARNESESRVLAPHNMGMIAVGMIDLMTVAAPHRAELGLCREVLQMGQRVGRISNVVFTFERELAEGDVTNEIAIISEGRRVPIADARAALLKERDEELARIRRYRLRDLCTDRYVDGLAQLHALHASLHGRI